MISSTVPHLDSATLSQLGYLLGKGTLYSLVIVLFVLPGLLYLFDRQIVRPQKSKEVLAK